MFTQLSLFDSLGTFDSAASFDTVVCKASVAVPPSAEVAAHELRQNALRAEAERLEAERVEAARIELASQRKTDEVRPMGDLARLVLARYDLMIRRREEMERRRREQPRPSIRVLSPPASDQQRVAASRQSAGKRTGSRRGVVCAK
jgi:hypothetical protein